MPFLAYDRAHANIPAVQYELPDGKVLDIGPERFSISEILFDAHRPLSWSPSSGMVAQTIAVVH